MEPESVKRPIGRPRSGEPRRKATSMTLRPEIVKIIDDERNSRPHKLSRSEMVEEIVLFWNANAPKDEAQVIPSVDGVSFGRKYNN